MGNITKTLTLIVFNTFEVAVAYHVVFAPKYRRQIIHGKIKEDIGKILRQLCDQKGIEIIEAELCPDHVHMLISIPPKYSVSQVMGYLKGKQA